jgi:prostaglandin-E synthase
VLWAQRSNVVYLTVALEDCKNPLIQVDADRLHFKGVGGTDQSMHEVTLQFLKEIVPDRSKFAVQDRAIEFALEKAESGYWERLLKDTAKQHWLRVNFNKWKEDDDSNCEGEDNLEDVGVLITSCTL